MHVYHAKNYVTRRFRESYGYVRMLVRGMYVERLLFSRPPKEIPVRTTHQEKNKESVMTYINAMYQ